MSGAGLIYAEFISRRPGVGLAEFHERAARAQGTWASDHGADRMILNAGRTWRVGPEPEYLCLWYTPDGGLDRLEDWDRLFADPAEREHHAEFESVARIDRAGCYQALGEPTEAVGGRYLLEWLAPSSFSAGDAALTDAFRQRAAGHAGLNLHCLARPLGALAPGGAGLALWGLPSWGSAAGLTAGGLVEVVDAALLADLGREQL